MYLIVKYCKNVHGVEMPVLILDVHDEVLEFENEQDAIMTKELFEKNSDSGHRYIVKKI